MHLVKKETAIAQSGNALFLILIAVALFAALSYAITQSGRGGGTISKEQSVISASQITQFPATVRTGVTRMIITGSQVSKLDFDDGGSGSDAVFASDGGGITYQTPPANIGGATAWGFADVLATRNAGAGATKGWFISGVGTDTAITGRDVFAWLDDISLSVCQQINKGLGLSNSTPRDEATTVVLTGDGSDGAAGNNAYSFDIQSDAGDPQPFACVQNNGDEYVYYHALVEQ